MINRIFTIALDRYGIKHEIYNMTEIDANKLNSQLESPNPEAK